MSPLVSKGHRNRKNPQKSESPGGEKECASLEKRKKGGSLLSALEKGEGPPAFDRQSEVIFTKMEGEAGGKKYVSRGGKKEKKTTFQRKKGAYFGRREKLRSIEFPEKKKEVGRH